MDVDFWGVVNGTKAFLPHVIASGDGHIVNVSSLFGLLSMPGQSAYNSAKFAVRGFTESLRQEMLIAKHPVKVTCVHPGGIKTAIARNATAGPGDDLATFAEFFDKQAGAHHARGRRQDHRERGARRASRACSSASTPRPSTPGFASSARATSASSRRSPRASCRRRTDGPVPTIRPAAPDHLGRSRLTEMSLPLAKLFPR